MDLPYTYSPKGKDYDIEILVDFTCTFSGYSGSWESPPEGPEFEINNIYYSDPTERIPLEEEKELIQFLSEDQKFYERMCNLNNDSIYNDYER